MKRIMKTAAICAAVMCLLTGCKSSDYKKAMALYEDKEYEDAYEIFDDLDDYKDSAKYAKKCKKKIKEGAGLSEYAIKSKYSEANVNSKMVYTNIANYCADAMAVGWPVPDGRYWIDLGASSETYIPAITYYPTRNDLEVALCVLMGDGKSHHYAVVDILSGAPNNVYYCDEDVFGGNYMSFSESDYVFNGKSALGRYPEPMSPDGI